MNNDKPIIGIDGNEANVENRVGVNTYAYELIHAIATLEAEWNDKLQVVVYLKNKPLSHMPPETKNFSYKVLPGRGLWIIRTLMPHLFFASKQPSVFWTPAHYLPLFTRMPTACSIMDLGYLESSKQFTKFDFWQLKLWTAWSIRKAKKIFAISSATKKDITTYYFSHSHKVVVTLLGYDKSLYHAGISEKDKKSVQKKYSIGDNYVLFMSTLKPSKNVEGLLHAWKLIEKKYPETQLIIAGKKGWLFENIFALTQKYLITDRVVFTGFVDEEDKPALISGAKAFVLPSFWEGFGLDVVSAMACGVPVLTSDRGSLPEVVGKAGVVVNPDKPEAIAVGIERILTANKKEYESLVKEGLIQSQKFDWNMTARKTIEVLHTLTK